MTDRVIILRYNQNDEITALCPIYGWVMFVLCIPTTVFIVTNLVQATEWWQYATGAMVIVVTGMVLSYGIKILIQPRKLPV